MLICGECGSVMTQLRDVHVMAAPEVILGGTSHGCPTCYRVAIETGQPYSTVATHGHDHFDDVRQQALTRGTLYEVRGLSQPKKET